MKKVFKLRGIPVEEFTDELDEMGEIEAHNGCECEILGKSVYVDEDFEHNYYDIKFNDGFEFYGISGYHLV